MQASLWSTRGQQHLRAATNEAVEEEFSQATVPVVYTAKCETEVVWAGGGDELKRFRECKLLRCSPPGNGRDKVSSLIRAFNCKSYFLFLSLLVTELLCRDKM